MCVHNLILATLIPSHLTSGIYIIHLNFHYVPWKDVIIDFFSCCISYPTFTQEEVRGVKSLRLVYQSRLGVWKFALLFLYLKRDIKKVNFAQKGCVIVTKPLFGLH